MYIVQHVTTACNTCNGCLTSSNTSKETHTQVTVSLPLPPASNWSKMQMLKLDSGQVEGPQAWEHPEGKSPAWQSLLC